MHSPRMNHACMMFEEMGRTKIMVAGGVTKTEENNNELTNTVEILDFDHASWKFASDIPKFVTGSKLIEVSGRPTLVGRYGSERQCVLSRYTVDDVWTQLPLSLLHGRSDFQVLRNMPKVITMFPNLNSKLTKFNPGKCGTPNWRSVFGSVENGKKAIFRTNKQIGPWIQLDLGLELMVIIVSESVIFLTFDNYNLGLF